MATTTTTLLASKPQQHIQVSGQDMAHATNGTWHPAPPSADWMCTSLITNSQLVGTGDVFLALVGERHDAHKFAASAVTAGASALVVEYILEDINVPQLVVADTRLALGDIAYMHRMRMPLVTVCALTGSSGKTTTKQLLGSILEQVAPTLITRGNLNNDLGVPMMLLELSPQHRYAVMELGANHVGEIAYTSRLVQPQVAGVLNIGTAHVGEFGGRDGIAIAKSEIYAALDDHGTAILPTTDDYTHLLAEHAQCNQCLQFGDGGQVYATNVELQPTSSQFTLTTPAGNIAVTLPMAGMHNISNALAAASFAHALNIDLSIIAEGLRTASNVTGRLSFYHCGHHTIIDDTYNANPHSMLAAAEVLGMQPANRRIMVIGDIAELGDDSIAQHSKLGEDLYNTNITSLYTVGELTAHTHHTFNTANQQQTGNKIAQHFADKATLIKQLQSILADATLNNGLTVAILAKGSRTASMETVLYPLLTTNQQ